MWGYFLKYAARFWLLTAILAMVFFVSLFIGRYSISVLHLSSDEMGKNIIRNYRLPRILMAALLGAALSIAGAALQSAFKNPLVSPGIIGVAES